MKAKEKLQMAYNTLLKMDKNDAEFFAIFVPPHQMFTWRDGKARDLEDLELAKNYQLLNSETKVELGISCLNIKQMSFRSWEWTTNNLPDDPNAIPDKIYQDIVEQLENYDAEKARAETLKGFAKVNYDLKLVPPIETYIKEQELEKQFANKLGKKIKLASQLALF